jgi:rifampicin phosphotransferase
MTRLVIELGDAQATDVAIAGGKGSSLARNAVRGFPVPSGLVVTADAYRLFVFADRVDGPRIGQAMSSDEIERAAAAVREHLAARPLPAELTAALHAALARFPEETSFAVRSSGTLEDMVGAAFAGQHDTFLGICGADAIVARVKDCFLSLWSGRAVAYRANRGFDQAQAAMAVVIQEMVAADVAGVAFTLDPIAGRVDRVIVEAAWGLGETVVSGEGETDQYVFARGDLAVVSRRIGNKTEAIVMQGRATKRVVTGERAQTLCLDDQGAALVAKMALAVEQAAGYPQDIEWAIAAGKLFLLQARPITTIPERWTRDESAERFPNPVTPLTWDFVERGFHEALTHPFALMGLPPLKGRWFAKFDNYIYGNQNAVEIYMGRPPALPRSLDELRATLPLLRKTFAWALDLPARWALDLDRYLISCGALTSRPLDALGPGALWALVEEINHVGRAYFRNNIAISITQSLLNKALQLAVVVAAGPQKARALLEALVATAETKTALVNSDIRDLALLAVADPALTAAFASRGAKDILGAGLLDGHPAFAAGFQQFLENHGHRELDFDPYCSNWRDSPWTALDTIILAARSPVEDTKEKAREARRKAREAERILIDLVPEDLRFFYSELIRLERTYTSLDDIEHYQTSRLTVPMRRALGALGARLMRDGVVAEPMDVYFAHAESLASACKTPSAERLGALRDEIAQAKGEYLAARRREPAWELGVDDSNKSAPKDSLIGIPGSPGIVEGVVHIVLGPEDFASFPTGAILVSRTTNPSWTPLFHAARAAVVESGGPLSHGAVTAREMGIPAVMAVRGLLKQVANGDRVRVNGAAGTIEIVQRA